MVIVKHQDMRTLRYCNRGARAFCLEHKINWELFLQQGIDSDILESIGDDDMVNRLIAEAKRRVESEGNP
jgi:hypothetical protein